MERLAAQGMMFTQAYACSISSPSRVSLFTGMNAARHRVTSWTLRKNTTHEQPDSVMIYPEWNVNGICQEPGIERTTQVTTLAQVLKDSGYHTIHCGKAHFGANDTPGEDPLKMGFEVNIAGHAAGSPASYYGKENFGNKPDGKSPLAAVPGLEKYHGTDTFLSEALTLEAEKALDNVTPQVEVKSRRVGGATFQVPTEIRADRKESISMKNLIIFARKRGGKSMADKLAAEIMDAFNEQGGAYKRKEDMHRMAEANRAFAHFRF